MANSRNVDAALDGYALYVIKHPSMPMPDQVLTMEAGDGFGKRIIKSILELLYEFLRRVGATILKLFDRTKGLKLDLANMKRNYASKAGRRLTNDDSTALGTSLSQDIRAGSRLSTDVKTISYQLSVLTALAEVLLVGAYPTAIARVGSTLERILSSRDRILDGDIHQINGAVEDMMVALTDGLRDNAAVNVDLMGSKRLTAMIPTPKMYASPITTSQEYQALVLDLSDIDKTNAPMFLLPARMDELGELIIQCETAVSILDKFSKDKVPEKLLKNTGDLQRRLNELYRSYRGVDGDGMDNSMIAFSRYMTSYTAWIQTPMADFATYYSRTIAAAIQVARIALSKYQ